MALNPMMASQMYSSQGGGDMTMIFIVVILFCCSIFCLFIYYYVEQQKEKEKEEGVSECSTFTNASTCGEDTSCSWDTSTFSCVTATEAVTCSLEQYVSNKACQSCETFPDGSFRVKSSSTAPANGPDTTCTVKQPCPEDYHVVSGSCEMCPEGKVNSAGSGPPSSDTECKRPFCSNTQKIICAGEGETGTCGERCCCEACPDGLESSIVPIQSPDDATESDTFCVQVGQGATRETVSSSTPLKDLCALGYHVDQNHNCVRCLPSATRTTYTQHDPNGGPTQCEKAPCTGGQRSDPDVPGGGLCRPCIGQETNEGNFRPNDPIYSTCLQCKHDSYIQNGECVRCPTGKTNSLSGGVPFLKTNQNMVGIATCKSPLCENNEKIVCTQTTGAGQVSPPDSSTPHVSDTAGPGNEDLSPTVPGASPTDVTTDASATGAATGSEWTCSCSPCGGNLEAAQVHTVHLEDIVPPPGSTSPYEATTCVAECSGAVYMGSVTEASHTISRCGSSPASCSEEDLTTMIDELNTLNETTCPNGPEKNTITALIEDIDTLLLQKPCPQDHRQDTSGGASGTDFCIDCCPGLTECDQIGSYPTGNITNFSNDHQHTEPRSAAATNTVCKKRLCDAGENLEKEEGRNVYRCMPCDDTVPMGAPLYSPAGGCSADGTIDGVESRTCTPGNGQHYVSPSDALPGDVTECRNPNAATCGDLAAGQGITCPDNYYPVTSAEDLLKRCQGSTCDSMNVDLDVCCVKNETCAGRILYEGNVMGVDNGLITLSLQDETNSLSDDISDKKIRFTVPSGDEITGVINQYEYRPSDNEHTIRVIYDIEGATVDNSYSFIILEELSSSCPDGEISNNTLEHCMGVNCDFDRMTDQRKCCIIEGTGYIVSPNQTCIFVGAGGEEIRLYHVIGDDDASGQDQTQNGQQKCKEAVEWIRTNKDEENPLNTVMTVNNGVWGENLTGDPFVQTNELLSPPGCWWWDPDSPDARQGARAGWVNRLFYNTREEHGDDPNMSHRFKKAICTGTLPEVENIYTLEEEKVAANPCYGVDCGNNGQCISTAPGSDAKCWQDGSNSATCSVGTCRCLNEYRGDRCEIAPPRQCQVKFYTGHNCSGTESPKHAKGGLNWDNGLKAYDVAGDNRMLTNLGWSDEDTGGALKYKGDCKKIEVTDIDAHNGSSTSNPPKIITNKTQANWSSCVDFTGNLTDDMHMIRIKTQKR